MLKMFNAEDVHIAVQTLLLSGSVHGVQTLQHATADEFAFFSVSTTGITATAQTQLRTDADTHMAQAAVCSPVAANADTTVHL